MKMPYVTSIEQIGIEQGIVQGGTAIARLQLQNLFGVLAPAVQLHILALPLERVQELSLDLLRFKALPDLEAWLARHPLPSTPAGVSKTAGGIAFQP
jgi:Domain of unknown function (DUF4351)